MDVRTQLMLALNACYLCLAAPAPAAEVYTRLDIKNIQMDSLSYIALPVYEQLGALAIHRTILDRVRHFQSSGHAEMIDSLTLAFQSSSYSQGEPYAHTKRGCARPRAPLTARLPLSNRTNPVTAWTS